MRIDREAITIAASKKAVAEQVLEAMRESDQRPAGAFVIRGRVRDNYGRPLANAQVDLMGRFVFINCFQTRDDGTFTMALTDTNGSVPEGSLYYLRVRAATERKGHHVRWNSRYFSLKRSQPEMVVEIAVPGE